MSARNYLHHAFASIENLAQAKAEAKRRGWLAPTLFVTSKGVHAVSGRDAAGVFHAGASTDGWDAAFADADKRAGAQ